MKPRSPSQRAITVRAGTRPTARFVPLGLLAILFQWGCADPVLLQQYLGLVNISPSGGAVQISVDAEISATFNARLDSSSLDEESLFLQHALEDGGQEPVSSYMQVDEDLFSVFLLPRESLSYDTEYCLVLTTEILSQELGPLPADVESCFTTTGDPDQEPPVAVAGDDQTVQTGDTAFLDGSASWDPDNDEISFFWSLISMPRESSASLDDPLSATPSLLVDLAGTFVIQLLVYDSSYISSPDYVYVFGEDPLE